MAGRRVAVAAEDCALLIARVDLGTAERHPFAESAAHRGHQMLGIHRSGQAPGGVVEGLISSVTRSPFKYGTALKPVPSSCCTMVCAITTPVGVTVS